MTGSPEEEDSSWLEKISQTNPTYDKKRILESKGPFLYKPFCWILDNEDFNRWRNTEKSGVFWIKGDPGKGKTMLLGGLIDNVEENPGNINLTYFFCQATDSRINTATAIIGGLIVSFIKQHQDFRLEIYEKYKGDLDKLNGPDGWYILSDMFEEVTQHPDLPYPVCIVDALDECEQEHGCKQLLKLIIETSGRVKWLISSRNITEIERELQAVDSSRRLSLELKENAEYVTKSVDLYINESIQNIMALKGDEKLQIRVTNTLKSKANGTFLWVALVIEQLRNTKHRHVENVLEEMPEGLENLYHLILKRLAKQKDKEVYQILLSTVTTAERPLRLEELLTFISFQWKDYRTTHSLRDIQDIVKDCRSFLSIRDDDNTVDFIHQSAKDYIMGAASKIIFPSGIEYQHYIMFTASLRAMFRTLKHNIYGLKDPGSDTATISPPNPDPLAPIAYCCVFWVEHLFRSCDSGASRDKIFLKDDGTLHSFLRVKYLCWLESLALLRSLVPQGVDAIQKLQNLLSGYYKSESNGRHVREMAYLRRERESNRLGLLIHNVYQLLHRCKDLYLRTYINSALTFFNYHDDSHIRAFVNDAYQFIHYCKDYVRKYPLQLYYSAVIFEDTHSAIYTTFQHIIRAEFKNTLTFIKMPQNRFSLVQNIELNCRGSIIALLYSPDSSILCSLSKGGTLSLFRTDIYTLQRAIELDLDQKYKHRFLSDLHHYLLAFSKNSKHLISISATGIVQVWAVSCGTQLQKFSLSLNTSMIPRPSRSGYGASNILQEEVIALSYSGDLAASTCRTLLGTVSSVKVWAIEARKCIYVIDQSHMPNIIYAAFSPNSAMIALSHKEDARVYSVQTRKEIKHMSHPSHCLGKKLIHPQFSPDSKLLALRYANRDMYLWCTETWTVVRHFTSKFSTEHFNLSPNATMSVLRCPYALLIESMDTGEPLLNIKSHAWVNSPIFSPDWTDSSLLASFSFGAVQIWRAYLNTKGKPSEIRNTVSHLSRLPIFPKSKFVTALDYRGNIRIWSGESGECTQVLEGNRSTWPFPHAVFSPNQDLVACVQGDKSDVQTWHVETGRPLHLLNGPGGASGETIRTAFSDDSGYVVTGYSTGLLKVWCVKSGTCLCEIDWCDEKVNTLDVAFSPGSRYITAAFNLHGGYNIHAAVCIWDWRTGQCISRIELQRKFLRTSLTFSSDATVLVMIAEIPLSPPSFNSMYRSYAIKFYDITSGTCLSHIDIKSKCLPFYDPPKDHIVSDRFRFCKRSSWRRWDTIPQPGYSCFTKGPPSPNGETWICFGERKVFQVPREILENDIYISGSLLVCKNTVGELFIIHLPSKV